VQKHPIFVGQYSNSINNTQKHNDMKVEHFFLKDDNTYCVAFGTQYLIDACGDYVPAKRMEIEAPRLPEMNLLEDAGRITADDLGFDDCPDDNARIFNLDYRVWFVEIESSNCEFAVYAFRELDEAQKFATDELYRICSECDLA
jgi:hypothetical protein